MSKSVYTKTNSKKNTFLKSDFYKQYDLLLKKIIKLLLFLNKSILDKHIKKHKNTYFI